VALYFNDFIISLYQYVQFFTKVVFPSYLAFPLVWSIDSIHYIVYFCNIQRCYLPVFSLANGAIADA